MSGAIDVSGTERSEIWFMTRAGVATAAPPKHEQSFGGGGGDLLSSICPELGVAPLVDPGTDCEDELPTPACPPAVVDQHMDRELQKVFIDVVSLPTMVTPVCDMDGTHASGGMSGGCTSCHAGPRELAVSDSFIGGAKTCVADSIFSPAGVGGCLIVVRHCCRFLWMSLVSTCRQSGLRYRLQRLMSPLPNVSSHSGGGGGRFA